MSVHVLSSQVSVSGQINADDLSTLSKQGVELIVCNRPDNEDEGQPSFEDIASQAHDLGIETAHIPFSGSDYSEDQVQALSALLSLGKKTHLYCRSGNRSSILWQAAMPQS